ncbi:MAG: UDP-N-acetylglucosamine 1-carboxyvinyltransferase [Deltaproteobacteria bacterium RIFCSPLOWO2_01_44_7]|nr:MAG: UDP-N-acetylglucosamine 1-carboxyvinyltransferase [Deltaproteobacteria bacterium RIFCSPHIGHO2_01_FULL_43_49]OGQ14467.1 MAG: UDP-N-acetylglucosamine 1-carboxyvinyltransferase [Deltaproteobacteria bacterium RIFCSPHIGHO2_02_FULL_44_53]OGQ27848.1 MAG: UDP-N-acetylglucosamine 1-carboxyvinyltransferase [Deltaproteobacteria bacterium RIFCSPHIGHO2_12_FULL_44_21]OGQ30924.1 MAG: UDP-N-acetylglucosamine 1-carboxyvinyltransferase [Deltaproteobacteria bacterium RIFCSPLOWO2_01_FULL_45_74]OGQ41151.1 M
MEKLVIEGGLPLRGSVTVSGAKNSVLPLMAATMLTPGTHRFTNVPKLRDVTTMQRLLAHLGVDSQIEGRTLTLTTNELKSHEAPYDLVKTMRASVLVLCPLVARWGKARVSLPGGCAIGARPIDLHLKALKEMGATIEIKEGYVEASAEKLKGAHITFDTVTVTGTENLMMAASLAEGATTLKNAAREPEIGDLANYLNKMGAKIEGAGTDTLTIQGVSQLKPSEHSVIADRIEAATFLMAGAITGGEVTVKNCPSQFLEALIDRLKEAGCTFDIADHQITIKITQRLKSVNVTTSPFPGFATDLQAQFMALMTLAEGTSVISETIFENRFQHALELKRLGADITLDGRTAIIKGVEKLSGAPLMATDLRASASLILAGLAAEGTTIVDRAYHIDRGYEHIEERLARLGAKIKRQY